MGMMLTVTDSHGNRRTSVSNGTIDFSIGELEI
jgi:hypothetical protein